MITQAAIENAIRSVEYHLFHGATTMACCLTLTNGHTVVGLAHCAKDTVFDPKLGEKYSREDAEGQIGELLAFEERGPTTNRSTHGSH
jgi:hypothetical protein